MGGLVKWNDEIWREYVDERIANIAFVLQDHQDSLTALIVISQ